MDLAGTWKFFKGDNKSYAQSQFDDALWKDATVPGTWQDQGNPDLKGFAWYRKHVALPARWGSDPLVTTGKAVLYLDLGKIADAYEIYWNGGIIAAGGKLPPAYAAATGDVHAGVPADKSTFGGDNVLAVRVYGQGTASGIVGGPLSLREPTFADYLNVSIVGKDNRAEFTGPDGLTFDIVVENQGDAAWQKGTVMVSVLDGAGKTIVTSPMMVDVNPQKVYRATLQLKESDLNPGIYTVNAATQMGGATFQTTSKTFVFNPGGIRSTTFKTPDQIKAFTAKLDTFWKTTLTAVKATPLAPTAVQDTAKSTDKVKVYKVTFAGLKGQTIYGWYCVPAAAAKSPGVVVLPGYGNNSIEPPTLLAESGFAALAINVLGSDVDSKTYPSEADSYAKGGFADPNTFVMRGMVVAGIRAVDFLAQRPEVRADRLGVAGMSQGGGLALDVAALEPRVVVAVASSPAADFPRMFSQARRNPASGFLTGLDAAEKAQLEQTMAYFDPAFLAARIRIPTLISLGMKDDIVPPETAYTVKNSIPQGVAVMIQADEMSGHQVTPSQASASLQWLTKFLIG
jgi:cephalosporin-C deacetylase